MEIRTFSTISNQQILDMHLRCYGQDAIAQAVEMSQPQVNARIDEIIGNSKAGNSDIFDNFEPELYTVWNFAKATNEVRHFGNIPPEKEP